MRNTFVNTIVAECEKRDDIYVLTGDAGLGVFDDFKQTRGDRFINCGIAEQNMASFAAGLALTGFRVYAYNIIPFLLYRCYEQVRNDICYQELPVTMIGIGSGVTYAPAGVTHYSVEDLGLALTLPNLTIISPMDPVEAKAAATFSLSAHKPVYVRMAKRGEPRVHANDDLDITLPQVIRDGDEIAVIFHGSISEEVMKAHGMLAAERIYPRLISVPMIQPLNVPALIEAIGNVKAVVCVEEHFEHSGIGNMVSGIHSRYRFPWHLEVKGIPPRFIHEIKDQSAMRSHFGISAVDIAETVRGLSGRRSL